MGKIKLEDYWNNGNIDVILNDEIIAEVMNYNDDLALSFKLNVNFVSKIELECWINENSEHLIALYKSNSVK